MNQTVQRSLCESIQAMESAFRLAAAKIGGISLDDALLLRTLLMVAPVLDAAFDHEVRKHSGIGKTEFRILMMLYSRTDGCAAPSELCEAETMGRANMTRIADVLVTQGLATRTAGGGDRRRIALCITAEGRNLVARLAPNLAYGEAALFEGIGTNQRRQLSNALKRIASNIDAWNHARR